METTRSIGENWQSQTPRLCPRNVPFNDISTEFHIFTVLSCEPDATMESFGAIDMILMSLSWPRMLTDAANSTSCDEWLLWLCLWSLTSSFQSAGPNRFHRLIVLSTLAVTQNAPPPFRAAFPPTSYFPIFCDNPHAPIGSYHCWWNKTRKVINTWISENTIWYIIAFLLFQK